MSRVLSAGSARVEAVRGNIRSDAMLAALHSGLAEKGRVEKVLIARGESMKNRLRLVSDKGRDVIIDVPRGSVLRDGDVLSFGDAEMLVVEWLPEDVVIVTLEQSEDRRELTARSAAFGYFLGMKHYHPVFSGNEIVIPVEGAEEEMLRQFREIKGVNMRVEKRVIRETEGQPPVEHHR